MEYLTGETLADRLDREKRLPVAVAVDLAEQILLGCTPRIASASCIVT